MSSGNTLASILVVDDAPDTLEVIRRNLEANKYRIFTAAKVDEALAVLDSASVELVITDLKMPGTSGMDLIRHVRENIKDTEIIMITGYASVEGAVQALKLGAEEYLPKPFTDEELLGAVNRALEKRNLRTKIRKEPESKKVLKHALIGESVIMQQVLHDIAKSASTSATVLISGESGTGKELVARAIHYNSSQASGPFAPVNCGAIPEGLLESELFGHVKGAFTGASESRAGFFQTADGGTVFLDEISEISHQMQVKLLRVIQEKEVYMVGSNRPRRIDVRILASTNKNLLDLVKNGVFREDLYYRLNVLSIKIPPLRSRENDILLLIRHFTAKYSEELGRSQPDFADSALEVLRSYNWPGNVRELENVIQRLIVMADSDLIEVPDLPDLMRFSALRCGDGLSTLAEMEMNHIRRALTTTSGNKTKAAEILGVDRKTLRDKIKRYKLT